MYGNIINEAFGKVTAKSLNVFITQIKCNAYAVLQISMKRLSLIFGCKKGCKSRNYLIYTLYCGETGIRTPGTSQYNGFQDRRNRPLCHLSKTPLRSTFFLKAVQRYAFILKLQIVRYFFCQKNFKSYFCIQITNVSKKELKHDISSEL